MWKKQLLLVFAVGCLLSFPTQAQKIDTALIKARLDTIETYLNAYQVDKAVLLLDPILDLLQQYDQPPSDLSFQAWRNYINSLEQRDRLQDVVKAASDFIDLAKRIPPPNENQLAYAYLTHCSFVWHAGQFKEAGKSFLAADSIIRLHQIKNVGVISYYYRIGVVYYSAYGEYKKSVQLANEGIDYFREQGDTLNFNLLVIYDTQGLNYKKLGNNVEAMAFYQKAIKSWEQVYGKESARTWVSYTNYGNILKEQGAHQQALENFFTAERIIKKYYGDFGQSLAAIYNILGNSYWSMRLYSKAIYYYHQSVNINKHTYGKDFYNLGNAYSNIAKSHHLLQNYDTSLVYIKESLRVRELNLGKDHPDLTFSFPTLSRIYCAMGTFDSALLAIQQAIDINQKNFGPDSDRLISNYAFLGYIYFRMEAFDQAIHYYNRANDIASKSTKMAVPGILADNYHQLAQAFCASGQFEKALACLEQVHSHLNYHLGEKDLGKILHVDRLPTVLALSSLIHFKKYTQDQQMSDLYQALEYSSTSLDIFQSIRGRFQEDQDREIWTRERFYTFEHHIRLCHELYQQTDSMKYQEMAWGAMESIKSFNLLGELRSGQAASFTGVSGELLVEERDFRRRLQKLEEHRQTLLRSEESQQDTLTELGHQIFQLRTEYDQFLEKLAQQHPDYYRLKYRNQMIAIPEIQETLIKDGEVLIQFLISNTADLGPPALFVMSITSDDVLFSKIPLDSAFSTLVKEYRTSLLSPASSSTHREEMGKQLYELLLKKPLETFGEKNRTLIIIPDGILNYLPFETLPLSETSPDYAFLLQRYTVRYAYSATLLQEQQQLSASSQPASHVFGGFAANYSTFDIPEKKQLAESQLTALVRDGLLDLPYAKREVESIAELMDGHSFLGQEASEGRFKEKAADYQILHLSLHTLLNDREPLQSDLVFTPTQDSLEDGFLSAAELYNLDLNAELAVLSACNTGFGKFQRGEGVMSLSRAMAYVGVPATVMSLWKVPDRATSQIMIAFYQYLKEGMAKDEALRQAKLEYLNSVVEPDQKQAYYWAGFVAAGDMRPIDLPDRSWWIYLSGLLVILGMGYWWWRKTSQT